MADLKVTKQRGAEFLWKVIQSYAETSPDLSQCMALELRARFETTSIPTVAQASLCPKCCSLWSEGKTCKVVTLPLTSKERKRRAKWKNSVNKIRITCKRCSSSTMFPGLDTKYAYSKKRKRKLENAATSTTMFYNSESGIRNPNATKSVADLMKHGSLIASKARMKAVELSVVAEFHKPKLLDRLMENKRKKKKKEPQLPKSSLQSFFETLNK
uniref:Uncharacterized protein n=1 Tax=Aplanochytrium stocchinoi TaxID=215587 RepID=A0A7S3PLV8_9STRA|mmetsp:Transcript_11534/g.14364  ORF Transcript_11534/g.14364 Transcript_11534/m.14364 type:complete len:214 (+) Transcript_11534:147-788(+)|eukprot:CAMPEP_0204824876 /NCGR_PEP_ID=MMETSP1346-20131115/2861_1 /ASSEMBLY_ACC=CAM_ASM_000771 /TAXON_ID=215587 /ORGANISM="Aplanochytrium stocchinoi, Strain GSBS06" /LENGTH=213 /DNA_ID=CAMNT_0051952273 /DNA_START=404 /DNA_END=1045 /DNA_ORIENTATION=-